MSRVRTAFLFLLALPASLPAQEAARLPRWRGFNLLEKFTLKGHRPFVEDDFKWISEWGFDFVRLPCDYRTWIRDGDWRKIDENALRDLDQAVEWGRTYRLHVSLNFHRGPGYCVNPPAEPRDLWTDPEALEVCALHWAAFARRYKGIPNERLSFDLLNEPGDVSGAAYLKVARALVEAIRREDPDRLVIADGARWGNAPVPELAPLGIAQSTRGYQPMRISHHRASWIRGSDAWPLPSWPLRRGLGAHLYGPGQPALASPLVLKADFPEVSELALRVQVVSQRARLVVRADDAVVLDRLLVSGPEPGEARQVVYREALRIYQNVFDRDYAAPIPAGTKTLTLQVTEGDWLSFSRLRVPPRGGRPETVLVPDPEWGRKAGTFELGRDGRLDLSSSPVLYDRAAHWKEQVLPWKALEARGVGVHVGEWGAFNRTPHDVALAWMEDLLRNWKDAGWGWALWNFRGSFGVLDSGRADVAYEEFRGRKLDRAMLELLRRY